MGPFRVLASNIVGESAAEQESLGFCRSFDERTT
jgi:hypothetical protein